MQTEYKRGFDAIKIALISAFALALMPDARAVSPHLTLIQARFKEYLEKNKQPIACNDPIYTGQEEARSNCYNACRKSIEAWKSSGPVAVEKAINADSAVVVTTDASGSAAVGKTKDQLTSAVNQKDNVAAGNAAMRKRAGINGTLASELEKCASDVHKSCKDIAPKDRDAASELISTCESGQSQATTAAGTNSSDSLSLGQLGQGMDLLTKGLGLAAAAAQMASAGQGSGSSTNNGLGATAPTPSSLNAEASGPEVNSFGAKNAIASPTAAFSQLAANGTQGAFPGAGVGANTSAASVAPSLRGSGNELGVAGANEVGATVPSGGGSGASASSDSTGSSRPGVAGSGHGAGASGAGYEMNISGGRPMLGMKGTKADIDEFTGAASDASSLLADSGARGLASMDEENTAGEQAQVSAETIFARVRSKYAVLKEKGRF